MFYAVRGDLYEKTGKHDFEIEQLRKEGKKGYEMAKNMLREFGESL